MQVDLAKLAQTDPDEAANLCLLSLEDRPDDPKLLYFLGLAMFKGGKCGAAIPILERVTRLAPDHPNGWSLLGGCLAGVGKSEEAMGCFEKGLKLAPNDSQMLANTASTLHGLRRYEEAIHYSDKALKINPNEKQATVVKALVLLAKGEWEEGFRLHAESIGNKFRKRLQFAGEPQWNGEPGTVVLYGEQGLGDEIMYASCFPDAQRDCTPIVECDPRLEGLFKRSFPTIEVHGTRLQEKPWVGKVDWSFPVGQLPQMYRKSPNDCPGTPYLIADPERRLQWRALFDSWGKRPKIGLCWSGGSKHNKPKQRAIGLEALRPLIEGFDADWVSLQYTDHREEISSTGLPVRHYRRACETDDYDDTAGLVAELDMVIGVHTTAQHLAGALGVKSIILVPSTTIWLYELDRMPWYGSATLFKQRDESWKQTVERLVDDPALRWLRP